MKEAGGCIESDFWKHPSAKSKHARTQLFPRSSTFRASNLIPRRVQRFIAQFAFMAFITINTRRTCLSGRDSAQGYR
jgi:hypothetical protein